jgi:quinol monooxygenase YgiN
MTMRVAGDPSKVEEFAAANATAIQATSEKARQHGCIRHRFYGSDQGIMVVDEWPDEASFQAFFEASPEIKDYMAKMGVTAPPQITFWRLLETHDDIG